MRNPYADAVAPSWQKACVRERLLERRGLAESCRFDGEVAVRGVRGDREVRIVYPHVDGVRPDNDDCVTVQPECVERIEKHSPSQYVQLIHAMPFRSRPSTQSAPRPRQGHGRGL